MIRKKLLATSARWKRCVPSHHTFIQPPNKRPISATICRLGFVVYPTHRRVKARNVVKFTRKLKERWAEYCAGKIPFAEFDASVKGWVNHVRYADTWGLRTHVLSQGLVFQRS